MYTFRTQPQQSQSQSRNAELKARARFMRRHPTASEHLLWRCCLSGKRLLGVQFRRQVPLLGCYIVDFLAPKLKLVVEVDGGYHDSRLHLDSRRQSRLERAGYRVVRLSADLVMLDLPSAAEVVARAVRGA